MGTTALARIAGADSSGDPRLPAPIDKHALRSYLAQLEDPDALALQTRLAAAYDKACAALIGPDDVQVEGARTFKKKSAWRKLGRYFGISTSVVAHDERFLNDEAIGESMFVASCTVRAVAPWGQSADATAACATDEETGRRKISVADAIATAETRATNRAVSNLVAMGEVSAEETTREAREEVAQRAIDEMTVEEAAAVKFPWRQPEKYRDKPLGELSLKMLRTVLDGATKEIEKGGATPRRLELQFAAQLLIAAKELAAEQGASGRGGEAEASVNAVAPTPTPSALSMDALAKRVHTLLQHEKVTDAERADFTARAAKATSADDLQRLVIELEEIVTALF